MRLTNLSKRSLRCELNRQSLLERNLFTRNGSPEIVHQKLFTKRRLLADRVGRRSSLARVEIVSFEMNSIIIEFNILSKLNKLSALRQTRNCHSLIGRVVRMLVVWLPRWPSSLLNRQPLYDQLNLLSSSGLVSLAYNLILFTHRRPSKSRRSQRHSDHLSNSIEATPMMCSLKPQTSTRVPVQIENFRSCITIEKTVQKN